MEELLAAVRADPALAEPHIVLARLYRRLGQTEKATEQVAIYKRLHDASSAVSPESTRPEQP